MTDELHRVLHRAVANEPPPPGLLGRIVAEVAPVPAARPAGLRRLRLPHLVPALGAVAAAAVVLLAVTAPGPAPVEAQADLATAALEGTASIEGGTLVVDLVRADAPPAGHHYEIWVLRRGGDAMEEVGSFRPHGAAARLELRLPGPGEYAAVDVSLEDDGGPPSHSGTSVATGTFAAPS
jgi:anti-sigma-K factor RskA